MVGVASTIPARSKAQAQEWSLVLLSQGIESAVEIEADGQWQIFVDAADFGKSARILRLYTIENRRLPQPPQVPQKLLFDWGQTWFFALLTLIFVLSETAIPGLRDNGRMDGTWFAMHEWWRPMTAVLLHKDLAHFVANTVFGMLLLGLAGGMFGTWPAFAMSYAAGAIANIIGGAAYGPQFHSLGASGMVMAALGLLTSFSLAEIRHLSRRSLGFRGVAGGLLLLVLLGFNPQTDVLAHTSGFFLGMGFGYIALWFRHNGLPASAATNATLS